MKTPVTYPNLLIIPAKTNHKKTTIILHGRGSTAETFASPLLNHPATESNLSFQSHFPHTKFIFPTASLRRAVAYNRSLTHQWFDLYPLDSYPPEHREYVQLQGIKESVDYIHGLLRDAVEDVGAENVVIMGLSQGCAVSLMALLLWEGERLGAFVGMCGWLPLREGMLGVVESNRESDVADDVFERGGDDESMDEEKSEPERVFEWLREELEMPVKSTHGDSRIPSTPVFLGHGSEDEKVPFDLGKLAARCLGEVGVEVIWREYQGLGHWYSADMLKDVVEFIRNPKNSFAHKVVLTAEK